MNIDNLEKLAKILNIDVEEYAGGLYKTNQYCGETWGRAKYFSQAEPFCLNATLREKCLQHFKINTEFKSGDWVISCFIPKSNGMHDIKMGCNSDYEKSFELCLENIIKVVHDGL